MNYCVKCGTKLPEGSAFCPSCGNKVGGTSNPQPVVDDQATQEQNTKEINRLPIIAIILFFLPALPAFMTSNRILREVSEILTVVTGFATLAGIVLMIVTRVKYPKNRIGKIVMWVMIGCTILGIIGSILLVLACMVMCRGC